MYVISSFWCARDLKGKSMLAQLRVINKLHCCVYKKKKRWSSCGRTMTFFIFRYIRTHSSSNWIHVLTSILLYFIHFYPTPTIQDFSLVKTSEIDSFSHVWEKVVEQVRMRERKRREKAREMDRLTDKWTELDRQTDNQEERQGE